MIVVALSVGHVRPIVAAAVCSGDTIITGQRSGSESGALKRDAKHNHYNNTLALKRTYSQTSSGSSSSSVTSSDDDSATSSSKRSRRTVVGALANGSSVTSNGYVAIESTNGLLGVMQQLAYGDGWQAAFGGDLRLMVRRVPSPDAKRSVQTKQLRLLLSLTTDGGDVLTVPYLLMDLCDKKGISNKPGSRQYNYAAYSVRASEATPSLVDSQGRRFEVALLLTCDSPTTTSTKVATPNNIRSKSVSVSGDACDRQNCTLLYQTEPKFCSYRVRVFARQIDVPPMSFTGDGATLGVSLAVSHRQLDLVEWGHNQKPTTVAHAGFVPVLEEWTHATAANARMPC